MGLQNVLVVGDQRRTFSAEMNNAKIRMAISSVVASYMPGLHIFGFGLFGYYAHRRDVGAIAFVANITLWA